ncbi:hypothetical protein BC827DRAFT_1168631 [Russula dissimulans]|nr:hypothetical protein BC827DRAFT_1168631 [Russula dissimulans]
MIVRRGTFRNRPPKIRRDQVTESTRAQANSTAIPSDLVLPSESRSKTDKSSNKSHRPSSTWHNIVSPSQPGIW